MELVKNKINNENIKDSSSNFENYVKFAKEKSDLLKTRTPAVETIARSPPTSNLEETNPVEIDRDEDHMMNIVDCAPFVNCPETGIYLSQTTGFTIEELRLSLPEAPDYKKFYTTKEAIDLCCEVLESGIPNLVGKKIEVRSGFNIPAFKLLLQGYEKEELVLGGIRYGWPLNWSRFPPLHGVTVPNHPTVEKEFPLATKEWREEQICRGMIVGPIKREELPWDEILTIPLHSVIKEESSGSRRFCADASFIPRGASPDTGSLNMGIPRGEYLGKPFHYNLPTINDFISDAALVGLDRVVGFKIDWSHAYRQNTLCPSDWKITLLHFNDLGYFMDIRSNFGIRSSGVFNQLGSESISYMLRKIKLTKSGKWVMRTYFDDEIVLSEPQIAEELFKASLDLHKLLGIRISSSKDHVIAPTRVLYALGVVLDFDTRLILPSIKQSYQSF